MKEIGKYWFQWMMGMMIMPFLFINKTVMKHFFMEYSDPVILALVTWAIISVWTTIVFAIMDSDKNKGEEGK
jgi:predicted Co/Zn/Cd cation transporter (cation efflux family)